MSCARIHRLRGYPLLAGLAASLVLAWGPLPARASSHAEAPMIAEDPEADGAEEPAACMTPMVTATITTISAAAPPARYSGRT